ncbi:MAG: site-specific integrase [Burkholderiales bacterium]|nr:site-specific integrase [Burkholderiales bacterium]MBP6675588.1 site-specific integrase [Vitreoscilla sp.]
MGETAYRAAKVAGAVFRYGVQHGLCESDPSCDLRGAVLLPVPEHRAAVTDPKKLGELLSAFDAYMGTPVVRALALQPMVFVRPGELRHAEWAEFDLDSNVWIISAARMKGNLQAKKNGSPHVVPQAVAILRELHPLTGGGRYVFPSPLTAEKPMSDNAVLTALRRMGFAKNEVTGHGFRATVRTIAPIASERLGIAPEVIEAQLAHAVGDALGQAYNRTQYLEQRRELMTKWVDYLDILRKGAQVLAFKGEA